MVLKIYGLLMQVDEWEDKHLIFKCPHCKAVHGIFVNPTKSYHNGLTNVWKYRLEGTTVHLEPSFDNSKFCGWHSAFNWSVEVMILEKDQMRNETTEAWLNT